MAEPLTSPQALFAARLRQLLRIELTLAERVLPTLLDGARSHELRRGFERHLLETRAHAETLRTLLRRLAADGQPEESAALAGLIADHERLVARLADEDALLRDLAHAEAAAQTEHLEIAAYDTLASLADALGEEEAAAALREIAGQERFALEQVERAATALLAEQVESARLYTRP
ncbi:MAG TPA: DUF892 family protein [Gaiellaceae bacterium]|nr:DUF892 family protein [Gaiellaceae bacterium]